MTHTPLSPSPSLCILTKMIPPSDGIEFICLRYYTALELGVLLVGGRVAALQVEGIEGLLSPKGPYYHYRSLASLYLNSGVEPVLCGAGY